jgi:HEAT repeat protein
LEWLLRTDFDRLTEIALWSIAAVLVTTLVLFVYTVGLRVATVAAVQRRNNFLLRWRDVFAISMLDAEAAVELRLPYVRRSDRIDLLEEWNRTRSMVDGAAVDNLIALARRTRIPKIARKRFHSRRMSAQILAVQTLGHLRESSFRDEIAQLLEEENTALSITAAAALVDIDSDFAIGRIVPMISNRRDWPKNRVSVLLRDAGSDRVSEPLYRAIRSASNKDKTYLLQFARLMESETLDAMLSDLIRENNDAGVINAALKIVRGYHGVPRIAALTQHDAWFVRMQAANVLGRIGQQEHVSLLEALLDDREWWVRYRAAQAITRLPFLGPNRLRRIRLRQADRYATDILQQAFAEAGLA